MASSRLMRPLKVYLVVGEESGDQLAAPLMRSLRDRLDGQVEFRGVAGDRMIAEGMETLFPIDDIAVMGLSAVLGRLPTIVRRVYQTVDDVVASDPDVLVIIDSPDFTHNVAKRVRKRAPHIRIVDYVSPSVWAWRPGRARKMAAYVDRLLAILPFEPAVHERLGGPRTHYVGHSIIENAAPDASTGRGSAVILRPMMPRRSCSCFPAAGEANCRGCSRISAPRFPSSRARAPGLKSFCPPLPATRRASRLRSRRGRFR